MERNDDGCIGESSEGLSIFKKISRTLGKGTPCELAKEEWLQARFYVLKNCDEIHPFLK